MKTFDEAIKSVLAIDERQANTPEGQLLVANVQSISDMIFNSTVTALEKAASALVAALETCHVCSGEVCLDAMEPTHCEDCSGDCDNHAGTDCVPLYVRVARVKAALKNLSGMKVGATPSDAEALQALAAKLAGPCRVLGMWRGVDDLIKVTLGVFWEDAVKYTGSAYTGSAPTLAAAIHDAIAKVPK